jgi:alkanesulfonate monooxygenase SsuD/methylene tetrahydromethanopterin reductase-like flavin-dependent oxidoreductase (luciferase family)
MEFGLFVVPYRAPTTDITQGLAWDLKCIGWAEEYGLHEVWIAEHFTLGWENVCAPELLIAAAAQFTKRIRLATGANLLPYHNPIALAHRLMMLDHLTNGRLITGFGASAYETDAQLFGIPDLDQRRDMTKEALDIILSIWTKERPFSIKGKYWSVNYPAYDDFFKGPNWTPFQKPHPKIAVAGVSPGSSSIREAGRHGYIPLSFDVAVEYLRGHWDAYIEGAESNGLKADRKIWRIFKMVFTADTDEEAMKLAESEPVRAIFDDWTLPLYQKFGLLGAFAPGVPEDQINAAYLARASWLVGSPETVINKIRAFHNAVGGFGVLVTPSFDMLGDSNAFRRNLELIATKVEPALRNL